MLSQIQMNAIYVVFTLLLFYVRGDTKPAKPKQNQEIHMLSFCLTRTRTNTWHLLSGSDVPRASCTFNLHTFMLIIKYERLKSFLRKAEENGFTLICVLEAQMSQHCMKSSIIVTVTKGTAKLERWTAARYSPACQSLWGQSTDPTAQTGLSQCFVFFPCFSEASYITAKDHNGLGFCGYQFIYYNYLKAIFNSINGKFCLMAFCNYECFYFFLHLLQDSEHSAWHAKREKSQYSILWGC